MRRIVYDNIIYSLQQTGGISMVWSALNDAVLRNDFDVLFVERKGAEKNVFRSKLSISDKWIMRHSSPLTADRYMRVKCDVDEPFIFHSSYYRDCTDRRAYKVVTVHDFAYERVKFASELARKVHHWQKMKAIRNADRIVCVSRSTYDDLLYFCPEIDRRKVSVIHNGVSDEFRVLHDDYDDYVLFVGSRASYKNFEMAAMAVAQSGLRLVVCGNALSSEEHSFLQRHFGKNSYIECVNADAQMLNQLYNQAYCLVYPSMYEGFGLPIIEAQKAGCPVIAYGVSSIPEVMGDSQLMIKGKVSVAEITSKINLLKNRCLRKEEIESAIENAKHFTLKKMQGEYIELYRSI